MSANTVRLGVNIDHVATVRNARGEHSPSPARAAALVLGAGADGITLHLREDQRHIREDDVVAVKAVCDTLSKPLNLEIASTSSAVSFALGLLPNAVCLVPERREEVTTEGGLDLFTNRSKHRAHIHSMATAGIRVSVFIEPEAEAVRMAADMGASVVEFHTGRFCEAVASANNSLIEQQMDRLVLAAHCANTYGLEVHAGHGLNYDTASLIATLPFLRELNIGHFIIGEAIFSGLETVVTKMRWMITHARSRDEGLSLRRKRALYRAHYRGFREADLVVSTFAQSHIASMDGRELSDFEALLDVDDPILYSWIQSFTAPPSHLQSDVLQRLRKHYLALDLLRKDAHTS